MANLTPRGPLNIRGSELTGSDGDSNRTYTLPQNNVSTVDFRVYINGVFLHETTDYTLSDNVVTFVNPVWDDQYISFLYNTEEQLSSDASLTYSSTLSFTKHILALGTVPDYENNSLEEVGTGNNSKTSFWLDKLGVIENTYTIYYGADEDNVTALVENTDYTIDLDTSKITLTSGGVTKVGTNKIFAEYKYNIYQLLNSEITTALIAAQEKLKGDMEITFADYTDDDPGYKKITDEIKEIGYVPNKKVFDTYWQPIVKLQTTTNGAYTTGGTSITLTDASGFPNSGTIYIGGYKVSYTAKSGNVLTVPSSTPSISDGATVRGEVVELSMEAEGNDPVYTVLTPEQDYEIDYSQGMISLLDNAFWGELSNSDVIYPSNYKIRLSYMHAWYEKGSVPSIPSDVEEITNMIAAKKFVQRIIKKSHIQGNNDFNPAALNSGDEEIKKVIEYYKTLNVGFSLYNKQNIS